MRKFYDIAKMFVADESRKALNKPFVYEGCYYATDGKIAYRGNIECSEPDSEDTHIPSQLKIFILEAHIGKEYSFEFDEEFVERAKCDYKFKLGQFLDEGKEENELYNKDIMCCPHCGEKVYYTGYDLVEAEEVEAPKESDFLYAVEVEGIKYNWRYIQMMMTAIPTGKWYVTKVKYYDGKDRYGLMRHSEEATAFLLALFPNTETMLKATIKKGGNNEQM